MSAFIIESLCEVALYLAILSPLFLNRKGV